MHRNAKPILRLISSVLTTTFFLSELSYAEPVLPTTAFSTSLQSILEDPTRFEAPIDFVRLSEVHHGNNGKLIIHIQDAHTNLSGQQNMAEALDQIMAKYGVSLVLSEGGSDDCSLTALKKIATPEVWKRLAKSYLVQGKISGEEYLNLVSDRPMKIMGIEDIGLYLKSVQNYAELAEKRESTLTYLKNIQSAVNKIKKKIYPGELLDYENHHVITNVAKRGEAISTRSVADGDEIATPRPLQSNADHARNDNVGDFKQLLELATSQNIDLSEFPFVTKLVELELKEKLIDFNLANLEQAALIEELSNRGAGQELKDVSTTLNQLKNSKSSQFATFQNILRMAQAKNVLMSKYSNFVKYGEYLKDFSEIDLDRLLEEFTKAEDRVYKTVIMNSQLPLTPSLNKEGGSLPSSPTLFPSFVKEGTKGSSDNIYNALLIRSLPTGRQASTDALLVRSIDRYIRLLQTAYQIQMTTKDFDLFKTNEPDFATPVTLAFINRKLAELDYFQDLIPYEKNLEEGKKALEAFYASVSQRDQEFLKNTEKILDKEDQKIAVLISGGYHTPHLKKLFAEKGYSMAVLTPIVTSETNQAKYEKLLLEPIRKEVKKVEIVQGESRNDKSLSALEKDLIRSKKANDGVKPLEIVGAMRLSDQPEKTGFARLAYDGARLSGQSEAEAAQSVKTVIASVVASAVEPHGEAISETSPGARLSKVLSTNIVNYSDSPMTTGRSLEFIETLSKDRRMFWNMLAFYIPQTTFIPPQDTFTKVLSLGCGEFAEALSLAAYFAGKKSRSEIPTNDEVKVVGVDLDKGRIRTAKHLNEAFKNYIHIVQGDATKLDDYPEVPKKADVIFIRHQNIQTDKKTNSWRDLFKTAMDRLEPYGILVITSFTENEHREAVEALVQFGAQTIVNTKNEYAVPLPETDKIQRDNYIAIFSKPGGPIATHKDLAQSSLGSNVFSVGARLADNKAQAFNQRWLLNELIAGHPERNSADAKRIQKELLNGDAAVKMELFAVKRQEVKVIEGETYSKPVFKTLMLRVGSILFVDPEFKMTEIIDKTKGIEKVIYMTDIQSLNYDAEITGSAILGLESVKQYIDGRNLLDYGAAGGVLGIFSNAISHPKGIYFIEFIDSQGEVIDLNAKRSNLLNYDIRLGNSEDFEGIVEDSVIVISTGYDFGLSNLRKNILPKNPAVIIAAGGFSNGKDELMKALGKGWDIRFINDSAPNKYIALVAIKKGVLPKGARLAKDKLDPMVKDYKNLPLGYYYKEEVTNQMKKAFKNRNNPKALESLADEWVENYDWEGLRRYLYRLFERSLAHDPIDAAIDQCYRELKLMKATDYVYGFERSKEGTPKHYAGIVFQKIYADIGGIVQGRLSGRVAFPERSRQPAGKNEVKAPRAANRADQFASKAKKLGVSISALVAVASTKDKIEMNLYRTADIEEIRNATKDPDTEADFERLIRELKFPDSLALVARSKQGIEGAVVLSVLKKDDLKIQLRPDIRIPEVSLNLTGLIIRPEARSAGYYDEIRDLLMGAIVKASLDSTALKPEERGTIIIRYASEPTKFYEKIGMLSLSYDKAAWYFTPAKGKAFFDSLTQKYKIQTDTQGARLAEENTGGLEDELIARIDSILEKIPDPQLFGIENEHRRTLFVLARDRLGAARDLILLGDNERAFTLILSVVKGYLAYENLIKSGQIRPALEERLKNIAMFALIGPFILSRLDPARYLEILNERGSASQDERAHADFISQAALQIDKRLLALMARSGHDRQDILHAIESPDNFSDIKKDLTDIFFQEVRIDLQNPSEEERIDIDAIATSFNLMHGGLDEFGLGSGPRGARLASSANLSKILMLAAFILATSELQGQAADNADYRNARPNTFEVQHHDEIRAALNRAGPKYTVDPSGPMDPLVRERLAWLQEDRGFKNLTTGKGMTGPVTQKILGFDHLDQTPTTTASSKEPPINVEKLFVQKETNAKLPSITITGIVPGIKKIIPETISKQENAKLEVFDRYVGHRVDMDKAWTKNRANELFGQFGPQARNKVVSLAASGETVRDSLSELEAQERVKDAMTAIGEHETGFRTEMQMGKKTPGRTYQQVEINTMITLFKRARVDSEKKPAAQRLLYGVGPKDRSLIDRIYTAIQAHADTETVTALIDQLLRDSGDFKQRIVFLNLFYESQRLGRLPDSSDLKELTEIYLKVWRPGKYIFGRILTLFWSVEPLFDTTQNLQARRRELADELWGRKAFVVSVDSAYANMQRSIRSISKKDSAPNWREAEDFLRKARLQIKDVRKLYKSRLSFFRISSEEVDFWLSIASFHLEQNASMIQQKKVPVGNVKPQTNNIPSQSKSGARPASSGGPMGWKIDEHEAPPAQTLSTDNTVQAPSTAAINKPDLKDRAQSDASDNGLPAKRFTKIFGARLSQKSVETPEEFKLALEDLDTQKLLALAYVNRKQGILGSVYNFLLEKLHLDASFVFKEEKTGDPAHPLKITVKIYSVKGGVPKDLGFEPIDLTKIVEALTNPTEVAAKTLGELTELAATMPLSQSRLISQARASLEPVNEFARLERQPDRIENILKKQAEATGALSASPKAVAGVTSRVVHLVDSDVLGDSSLLPLVKPQLDNARNEISPLGPESIVIMGENAAALSGLNKDRTRDEILSALRTNGKVQFITVAGQTAGAIRAKLDRLLSSYGLTDDQKAVLMAENKFGVTPVPQPSSNPSEYRVANIRSMFSVSRILARVNIEQLAQVDDRVISFIQDMIPVLKKYDVNEFHLALKSLHKFNPKFEKYLELAIKVVPVQINEILQFTKEALKAIGAAA